MEKRQLALATTLILLLTFISSGINPQDYNIKTPAGMAVEIDTDYFNLINERREDIYGIQQSEKKQIPTCIAGRACKIKDELDDECSKYNDDKTIWTCTGCRVPTVGVITEGCQPSSRDPFKETTPTPPLIQRIWQRIFQA